MLIIQCRFFIYFGLVIAAAPVAAQDSSGYSPKIANASNEGELAIRAFQIPEHLKATLFAAEPMLANPVAFCIDERGRVFVAETFRQQKGVEDNRSHMSWLVDDLSLRTLEDRLAMFKKHLGDRVQEYAREHDRIRLITDADGDGRADSSTVFADGFNDILDGTGAGVLARRGDVYYTCIPNLWRLRDTDGDGRADSRDRLHHGFGVRVAFRGHDLHGLRFGPDGRLYFSVGDRGYHVQTADGTLSRPETGAVFRCNADGSELEVYAYGLRNPQELAFDDYGNLFTGDNNSDGGDKARWVYVVPGGDSGWRMYYQYLPDRGPWNREKLWHPHFEMQAAYIVPPIANIADGPSGLVHYPGTGLSPRYRGHFFLCDFRGGSGQSGIRSFAVEPRGAAFQLVDAHQFVWAILATDVDFGYDGQMYVSDWVNGWEGIGKGRIYRFADTRHVDEAAAARTAEIMRQGFDGRDTRELAKLLEHPDQRVRQEAQFALVAKKSQTALEEVAGQKGNQIARLHAIWGLGQLARRSSEPLRGLIALVDDSDAEVRAQAAKVLGDCSTAPAEPLVRLLEDPSERVRFFAANSLGQLGRSEALSSLVTFLGKNGGDPWLRHAGVMGLVGCGDAESLSKAAQNQPTDARLGVLLALRRLRSPKVAGFLADPDARLVLEAARAIHDEPIAEAMPALAGLVDMPIANDRPELADAILRRAINAHFRLGTETNARALAQAAGDDGIPESLRLESVHALLAWDNPPQLDRVLGDFRPLPERPKIPLADVIRPRLGAIFSGSDALQQAAAKLAAQYGIKDIVPVLLAQLQDRTRPAGVRSSALVAIAELDAPQLEMAVGKALADDSPEVRLQARRILSRLSPDEAINRLELAISNGTTAERQAAIADLANMKRENADRVLAVWLDKLVRRDVPEQIQLDLIEAAKLRAKSELLAKIDSFERSRPAGDPLAAYRECLVGGNAERGRDIFFGRSSASCQRCHKINEDGGEVGPDLSKIGAEKDRAYLLESLVLPNQQIAKGFETVLIATNSGQIYSGILKGEDQSIVKLMAADGTLITIDKDDIAERATGQSAMPVDVIQQLSKSDLRDLVEFLSSLKP